MLQEQGELRSFITALRSGPLITLNELASDLRALADRLSRQWDVRCVFSAQPADMMIPARLHLDAHQLVREAVANAVRHAEAKSSQHFARGRAGRAAARVRQRRRRLSSLPANSLEMPQSLNERVEQAGGALDLSRGMGVTKLSISLPIGGRRP